jgi:hypothetical protein
MIDVTMIFILRFYFFCSFLVPGLFLPVYLWAEVKRWIGN